MMKHLITTALMCLLVVVTASGQFTQPGFYRVHNVASDRYISIHGTKYNKTSNPDAFWPCIKMLNDSDQISDPGSIVYIPEMGQTSLCAQGVSTYSLTGLMLQIDTATVKEGGKPTYVARTQYGNFPCIFRDCGNGLTAGFLEMAETRWWVEPVNASSIDTSYIGVVPVNAAVTSESGWYWASICCDFAIALPLEGGIEGAYTVKEVTLNEDGLYCVEPVKEFGQGDTVPAATPVLLKCKSPYASGNRYIPVFPIANCTQMPITRDMLMGNYFSNFINHSNLTDYSVLAEYVPAQSTKASSSDLALGVDAEGRLGFFPQPADTYMAANSAWLSTSQLSDDMADVTAVYLIEPVEDEPEVPETLPGDANGDGVFNIKDVTFLINFLLNGTTPEQKTTGDTCIITNADVDENGVVNIKDLTKMINMLLNNL